MSTTAPVVEAVAPLESIRIATPPVAFAANINRAERAIPLQAMEGLRQLKHRPIQTRTSPDVVESGESSTESAQASTPNSAEYEEQILGNKTKEFQLSTIVFLLDCLPEWFPKGPFAQQYKREMRTYNKTYGYSELKYIKVDPLPMGYPRLSEYQNSNNNFAVFRRFGTLSARMLIQLEVDLTDLETKLRELDNEDNVNPAMAHRLRGFENFEGWNDSQRKLISEIQEKLSVYFDLLLKDSQVRALGPATARHHLSLFNWMWNHKPLGQEKDAFIFHVEDFISTANHSAKGGRLADLFEAYLHCWPHSRIKASPLSIRPEDWSSPKMFFEADFLSKSLVQTERELKRSRDPSVDYYAPGLFGSLIKFVSVILAVSLLLVPIFLLFLVSMSKEGMAGLVLGFVLAFAATLSIATEAKTQELLIGTAAYAAVLATFLGNVNQQAGLRSG